MKSPGLAAAGIDSAAGDELQLLLDRRDLTGLIGGVSPRKGGKMTQVRLLPSSGTTSAVHAHPPTSSPVHILTHILTLTHTLTRTLTLTLTLTFTHTQHALTAPSPGLPLPT